MTQSEEDTKYTVFVKVPFPRGDFVDPPTANWNAAKEDALWKTLNSTPKGAHIDWDDLAESFSATPAFLLQQAAWLYERQLSHVREHLQVKQARSTTNTTGSGSGNSSTPPPGSGSAMTIGAQTMRKGGSSGGASSRAPSALSIRAKTSKDLRADASGPSTPVQARVPYSRTASTNTVTQTQRSPSGAQRPTAIPGTSPRANRRSIDATVKERQARPSSPSPARNTRSNLSSSSSSSSSPDPAQSRLYARRPRFPSAKSKGKTKVPVTADSSDGSNSDAGPPKSFDEDEEEEEDSPAFLPFSAIQSTTSPDKNTPDLGATLRRYSRRDERPKLASQQPQPKAPVQGPSHHRQAHSGSSSGTLSSHPKDNNPSASSSVPSLSSPPTGLRSPTSSNSNPGALAALSPRQRREIAAGGGGGSEGTPSMGSSFSDLDDASVTHSAMEEALANQMRAGGGKGIGMGMGSLGVVGRMGGLWRQGSSNLGSGSGAGAGEGRGRGTGGPSGVGRGAEMERRKSSR